MKKIFSLLLMCTMVTSLMAWDALYLIGDATSAKWNTEDAISMNKISEDEFEWTGSLTSGQMKILSGKDFKSQSYGPAHNQYSTSDNSESFNQLVRNCVYDAETFNDGSYHAYGDYKFDVETAGWYTVHINTTSMKISTYPRYIYPIGDGCEFGWNTGSSTAFGETSFGSGIYTGSVRLIPSDAENSRTFKFNCQKAWGVQYGPVTGGTTLSDCGVYDVNFSDGSEDRKWNPSIAAGTYNMTVDVNAGKLYVVPQNITVKAQVTKEAVAALGSVKCFAWTGIGSETKEMSLVDGFYTTTFSTYMPLSFLIYNGKFNNGEGGVQSVDMTNDGNGYYADKCVSVISRRVGGEGDDKNKMLCFHNDDCTLNTNSFTVNIYVEDAGWSDVYFFTQNAGDQNEYQNVFTHATKGGDNWYSYTFDKAANMTWVATATTENWNTQVNDVDNVNADKYFYVATDKHENGHNKIVSLTGKDQLQNRTFEFKFDGAAATSWGNESPVGLYYWQNYAMDGEDAKDHVNTILLSKNGEDVYTATVKALNNVKFVVQSDLEHGFLGEGHYTVEAEAGERSTGFNDNKKFWIRDNGSGHYVELTENFDFTPAEMHITLNKDGFASFYWDKNYELSGAEAYVANVSGEDVVLTKINGNGIIPARSAVVLYGAAGATADATETLDAATGYDYENALRGATTATTPAGNYYVLAEYEGETGFVKINNHEVPANRAYLPEPTAGAPARLRVRFAPEVVTGIDNVNDNANVNKYIRNGRVYIVRDNKVYTVTGQCVNL